jgi:hypothetical protein
MSKGQRERLLFAHVSIKVGRSSSTNHRASNVHKNKKAALRLLSPRASGFVAQGDDAVRVEGPAFMSS